MDAKKDNSLIEWFTYYKVWKILWLEIIYNACWEPWKIIYAVLRQIVWIFLLNQTQSIFASKKKLPQTKLSSWNSLTFKRIFVKFLLLNLFSGTSISENHEFIRGERVSQTAMTPLSALYRSAYPRYPAFPSIYESKYSHDFKYTFWPVERCKRWVIHCDIFH